MSRPCTCWAQIALHEGHCCFGEMAAESDEPPCDHEGRGYEDLSAIQAQRRCIMTPVERLRAAEALLRDGIKWAGASTVPPITAQRNAGIRIDPVVAWAMAEVLTHAASRIESKVQHGGNETAVWSHEIDALRLADALLGGGGA